jgi:hypothetical protein
MCTAVPTIDPSTLFALHTRLWNVASCLTIRVSRLQRRLPPCCAYSTMPELYADTAVCDRVCGVGALDALHLAAAQRALHAIEHGRYGHCAACGDALDAERLLERPGMRCCTVCEQGLRVIAEAGCVIQQPASSCLVQTGAVQSARIRSGGYSLSARLPVATGLDQEGPQGHSQTQAKCSL